MSRRPAHRPTIVTVTALASLGGLVLGRYGWVFSARFGLAIGVLTVLLWRSRIWWFGLVALALVTGVLRADGFHRQQQILRGQIGQRVTLVGTVVTDPLVNDKHQSDYRVGGLELDGRSVVGVVRVWSTPVRLLRGYRVELTGNLESGYATWDGSFYYPQLRVLSSSQSLLEHWRQDFFLGIRAALPEPEVSFGLGLLIGVGALIPKPLQAELTRVGLSHLVAVSGYNLTIIVRLVTRVLGRLGRNVALILSLWLIGIFVVISGASSSIVRAAVVSVLSLLAGHIGRRVDALALVSLAAAGTALYNPGYFNDLGWLLSFLAFFGILVLAPAIMARFGEPKSALGRMTIETLVAQIMTLPLIVGVFAQLSIIGLVANLVIEPFVPLAMLASLLAGLAGLWLPWWSDILATPASLLLGFLLQLIGAMAALPWALTKVGLTTMEMLACYGLMSLLTAALVWYTKRRDR
jgi:competence protein ComEC